MVTLWRLLAMAAGLARRSWGRFAAVVALLTVSVLVFLTVQAISVASADSLDTSVSDQLGTAGEYVITIEDTSLPLGDVDREILTFLLAQPQKSVTVLEGLGTAELGCTPDAQLGPRTLYLLRDSTRAALPLPAPAAEPGTFCLGGLDISGHATSAPAGLRRPLADGVVVDEDVAHTVAQSLGSPVRRGYLLRTGVEDDLSQALRGQIVSRLGESAALAAVDVTSAVTVQRVDDGAPVRRAAAGVRLVYGVISWAILLMAGMAVALTEMANVRDRNWLFGLARSAGATRAHIAFLVVADAVMLLSAAALTTAAALLALAPVADSFARSAFDYPLRLTDPAVAPQLALGAVAMLLVGAVLPANRAARLDPVDILERR